MAVWYDVGDLYLVSYIHKSIRWVLRTCDEKFKKLYGLC
jgi:hypothetical protein